MDQILSIYILRIKCSDLHIIHVLNIFMNSIRFVRFSLVWKEKLFKGGMRRSIEEVFTYAAFIFVSLREVKIDTKTAA